MNAVERAGQDQEVIGPELLQTWGEGAIIDQTASLVDYEKSEDDPS